MRKRRILAFMMALSLVVSGNGMTVLAAETGTEPTAEVLTPETGVVQEEAEAPEETETSGEPEETEKTETPETTESAGETETPETTEEPDETAASEVTEDSEEQEDPDAPAEEETAEPVTEESVEPVEEEEPEPVEEQGKNMVLPQNYVSRMVTFTDDTGMQVTYDANAATQYVYKVENGVLTAVVTQTTVSDNTIETPVKFSGNVELTQPEAGEQYTAIAAGVFGGNQNITYVKLPAGVETIGAEAFKGCTALKGVYLPAGVKKIENSAFENCTAMTQISVPKTVTAIGDAAFRGDTKLYLVYVKDADYSELTSIGAEAFSGCSVLSQLCSHSDFIFPTKLETIGASAFQNCRAIGKVDFSANKNLKAIGAGVFSGCTGLTDLTPGKTLSEIPEEAFAGCIALININFENGKNMTIGRKAFQGCYRLKQLVLPQTIVRIDEDAFQGCTGLRQVEIKCYSIEIQKTAFPANAENLVIVAEKDSNGYVYAKEYGFRTPDENAVYRYTVENVDGTLMPYVEGGTEEKPEGAYAFPGGTIWVTTGTTTTKQGDVNLQNDKKGVKSGEICYIYQKENTGYKFIKESLRMNGSGVIYKDGKYSFEMPAGGAVITAEFRADTPDNIKGQTVTVEFSNGTPLRSGETDGYGYLGVELKVGQTSRMFLLDEDGNPIPAQKLSGIQSSNEKVAKIDKNGVITAVGAGTSGRASAQVTVTVKGGDGSDIKINRTVDVTAAEAANIILKASDYTAAYVKIEENADGIQTASMKKNIVVEEELSFKLKANVYDEEEEISRELTWTTSNAKVAALKNSQTTAADPVNVVTVQKGCEGEATITVTAKNSADSAKEKVTQKFVVRVYEEGFRLTSSKITVNPNMQDSAAVELISAYGIGLENATIKLYEANSMGSTRFTASYNEKKSSGVCKSFWINPDTNTIPTGTYKVRVGVNGDKAERNLLPLTIVVKRAAPNPTVKFNTNKAKFNLFYKNGGTDKDGKPISVMTEITKLGDASISRVALEPLTQKDNDKLFTDNFVIDQANTDLTKGKVAIKRNEGNLKYKTNKTAAVTGYLVIYYNGYEDSAAKKVKVTMPTCTTAPSWALKTTKATYRANPGAAQEMKLVLYDKKSKTKEQVLLGEGSESGYTVTEEKGDISLTQGPVIKDNAIAVGFWPEKAQMKLVLRNDAWDLNKNGKERTLSYNFNVAVSTAKPTVKTDVNAVSLNLNYPEKTAQFGLVANPGGIEIAPTQSFVPVVTEKNAAEIAKLEVTYKDGVGTVGIKEDVIKSGRTVGKGTYKFECNPETDVPGLGKTVLTVKVVDGKPSVTFGKGSLQLNTVVYDNNSKPNSAQTDNADDASAKADSPQTILYRETSERTFKVKDKPEGYTLAAVGSGADDTKIVCTNRSGAEQFFHFAVEDQTQEKDGVLRVSLTSRSLTKGIYKFRMTPRYQKTDRITVSAKTVDFQVKVISEADIYLAAAAKGKINLVSREVKEGEETDKNGILYTPTLKNIAGEIEAVKIYDAGSLKEESGYFDIRMITEGKNKGKFHVTPKAGAELKNNTSYTVLICAQVKGYAGDAKSGGVLSRNIKIKTAQVLPKVTLSRTSMDVYLSTKNYDAEFVVKPKAGSVGAIEDVYFEEKDELANDSFELIRTPQADGSMKVTVHLKEAVGFANGSTNNVKFYVKYKGQGTNTAEKATGFTMKIKVN
ncbi:MAG: leucine-rich repeat domain-containing protein [Bacteroidales bacterium]|nr:leucine-rich repeat domain-containing protein [Bacteroidales bacterium]MCM1414501.1 leucine-rich repeat domain-containing protein [bacterium]MCM1423763.1 leucine-rich repeat domain-containing protein [bacterium]